MDKLTKQVMSKKLLRKTVPFIFFFLIMAFFSFSQRKVRKDVPATAKVDLKKGIVKYGTASYYAEKFNGRKTANGERYNPKKFTAACNLLPLNTWVKVTNLRNHKSVILKINDRLSKGNSFLVDVSKSAAKKLRFFRHGLAKVKLEPIVHHR
jgi:rare lipoprotein A